MSPAMTEKTELPRLVVVGGVPGAGKSTLIAAVGDANGVVGFDPDHLRRDLAKRWPSVPYAAYRWFVHSVFTTLVWLLVLTGPRIGGAMLADAEDRLPGVVLVHDTATRPLRRRLLLSLAVRRGWRTTLLLLDATRDEAITGQQSRGRRVDPLAFDKHWQRWRHLRAEHASGDRPVQARADETWQTMLVPRAFALPALVRTVGVDALTQGVPSPATTSERVAA